MDGRRGSFNANAANYHGGRPCYPDEIFETLIRVARLGPGCRVLEIGAGSGLATGPILATGARVVAVEPGGDLAAILRATFDPDHLEVIVDDFEHADLHGSFDLAVCATALHWLDTAVAIPRIGALLRPGGRLAAWWNIFGDPDRPTEFRRRLDAVYDELLPAEPPHRENALDVPAWTARLRAGGWFGPVDATVLRWTSRLTAESARRLWLTFPNIAELDDDRRGRFLVGLTGIIEDLGGAVDDPRLTALYLAQRVAEPVRAGGAA
jgi:SAM-dependent methyltransferase